MKHTVGKFFVQNFGCRATQADGAALSGVSWVVGNSHKTQSAELVSLEAAAPFHGNIPVGDIFAQFRW
ncbi:MAG: hypothetical protein LAP87_13295 [Acidobacteriia bacterium]|nr:hypothetical protein [Terriglobia bacterium]